MIIKIAIWVISVMAAMPVIIATYVAIILISSSQPTNVPFTPWYYRYVDALEGNGMALGIGGNFIPFYPRLWIIGIGLIGVICLFTFVYFTFHCPIYQNEKPAEQGAALNSHSPGG